MTLQRKLQLLLSDRKQKDVAKAAQIHPVTLSSYVCHGVIPGADIAVRLADALSVDLSWLLSEREEWPPVPAKHSVTSPPSQTISAA